MQAPTCPLGVGQPPGDLGAHVGREVVQHHVDLQTAGHVQVDQLEEGQHVVPACRLRQS